MEEPAAEVEAVAGNLTPPQMFPLLPGHNAEVIEMNADMSEAAKVLEPDPNVTPRPLHYHGQDPDPTPRASISPAHQD